MNAWMNSQQNVALIHKPRGVDVHDIFFGDVIHGCLNNQALADVRSTGAGIKCLYCTRSLDATDVAHVAGVKVNIEL